MPEIKEGETEEDYISRCIDYCMKNEGLSQEQASGKCYGLWKEKQNQSIDKNMHNLTSGIFDKPIFVVKCCRYVEGVGFKPDDARYFCNNIWEECIEEEEYPRKPEQPEKPEEEPTKPIFVRKLPGNNPDTGNPSDGQYKDESDRELICLDCKNIQPFIHTNFSITNTSEDATISFNAEDKDDFKATCVIGDKFYKGKYLSLSELQKAYKSLDGSYHDINHWGTTYLDGNPNIEYIVGYQDNVQLDPVSKALTADIHILKSAEKYQLWRGFVDINQKINKTPNVSISFFSSKKNMKAKDLPGIDFAAYGYKANDEIEYLYDLEFQALSTVFKGACSDKDGCGIYKQNDKKTHDHIHRLAMKQIENLEENKRLKKILNKRE